MLLGWALLVAPLLHTVTHAHGHAHEHGGVPVDSHGAGSVEHLQALFAPTAATPELVVVARPVVLLAALTPEAPVVERWNSVEEPQGP